METPIPGLGIGVVSDTARTVPLSCGAGVCLVLQGAKQMLVGDRVLRYEAGDCFASSIELPATRSAVEYRSDGPYVATSLSLDREALAALLAELPPAAPQRAVPAFAVARASALVIDAWDRYLALLDSPADIPMLAPSRRRELLYRLLQGPHGPMLMRIAREDGRLAQIRRAMQWLRRHFDEPVATATLADLAGMSVPAFNRHFRGATSLSPLQYQKMLRLQAARRALATQSDVARAAFSVGYESASQFSREYSRLFGVSPKQDAIAMRRSPERVADALI